jgi:hypothetical protein
MERKPKDIALLFMRLPKRKRDAPWHKPFITKGWVTNIKMDASLTIPHILEYIRIWNRLEGVHTHDDIVDFIVWNLTSNGEYSSTSAYDAQFFKATLTNFSKMVWKNWELQRSSSFLG